MALLSMASPLSASCLTLTISLIPQTKSTAMQSVKAPKAVKIHLLWMCFEISKITVVPIIAEIAVIIFYYEY